MKRLRSLLTLALLLPLAARSLEGEVTVYGTLMTFGDNASIGGATSPAPASGASQVPASAYTGVGVPQRFRLTAGTSNLGFKGGLDLIGEDLQVFFQVESTIGMDATESPSAWAARTTALGPKGSFGRAFLGNWDTPYKYPTLVTGPLRGLNPFDDALIAAPGFGVPATTTQPGRVNGKGDAAFNRRQGNSLQYWSPELHGFSGRLAVSLNEGKTASTPTAASISPTIYSGLLTWASGPAVLRYAHERHQDYFGLSQLGGSAGAATTNPSSTDQGHMLVAQVSLPSGAKLSALAERLSYQNQDRTAGAVKAFRRNAAWGLVQQRMGPHQLFASYGVAGAGTCQLEGGGTCTTSGLGASQLGAGYSYSIGPSFDAFAAYYQMVNQRSASYGVVGGPGAVAPGGDTRGFGVGLIYAFSATASSGAPKGL